MQAILLMFLIYFLLATGRIVQAEVREAERRSPVAEEGDGADDRRDDRADRPLRLLSVLERRARRRADVAGVLGIGVRYAGLWGVAAGVLNCIPYFGPTDHHGGVGGRGVAAVQIARR